MNKTAIYALLGFLTCAGGCASSKITALRVSGTTGAEFTAHYQAGAHSGSLSTVTQAERPATIVEIPGRAFSCDLRKKDPAAHLTAEICRGGKCVYRAEAPAGTTGMRIRQVSGQWQQERY